MRGPLDLRPGSIFADEFRVVGLLGRGGMGAVYRVEQLRDGRVLALKVLGSLGSSQARARERFELEARIGGRISSDHVVDVVAAGFEGDQQWPWLVMELLEGADLRALARRHGQLPRGMVRDALWQLVQGLAAAHRAGVIHRDLKPENVFVARAVRPDEAFTVKILDFGIAKLMQEGRAVASATSTVGTPLWIAPEQLNRGALSVQTDVWALGLLVFWALTGHAYWEAAHGDDIALEALLAEILLSPLKPASERARTLGVPEGVVPDGFDAWFERAVAREPGARFGSVTEAGRELDRALRSLRGEEGLDALLFGPQYPTLNGVGATLGGGGETAMAPGVGEQTAVAPVLDGSATQLFGDRFFRVTVRDDGIVVVARTDQRSDDLDAFVRSTTEVLTITRSKALEGPGVIVDLRQAPPRNDARFEAAMASIREFMALASPRVALVVSTVAGMLQLQRLAGGDANRVFREEEEAVAHLRAGAPRA